MSCSFHHVNEKNWTWWKLDAFSWTAANSQSFLVWRQLFFSKDSLSTLCLWSIIVLLNAKHGITAGKSVVVMAMAGRPAVAAGSSQTASRYCLLMKAALYWLHSLLLKQSYSWKWLEIIGAGCRSFHIQTPKSKRPKETKPEIRSVWVFIFFTYAIIIQYGPWNINDLNNLALIQNTKLITKSYKCKWTFLVVLVLYSNTMR